MDRGASGALLGIVPDGSGGARFDLAAIYRDHYRLVRWLARASGVPEHAIDDVTHDVFLAAYRRRDRAPHDAIQRWMVGVARSVCHAWRRSRARATSRLALVDDPVPPPSPEEALDTGAALQSLGRTLARLLPEQREAFVLVDIEGSSAPEAAEALGVNLNTLYSRLRLARAKVRREVGKTAAIAREADRPSAADVRRTWMLLAVRLGSGPPVVATSWAGGLAIGACLGVATLGGVLWLRAPEPTTERIVMMPSRAASTIGDAPRTTVSEPARVATAPLLPSVSDPSPTPVASPRELPRKPAPRRVSAPAHEGALAEETALLRRAAAELDAGRLDEGERLLDKHAQRFAHGVLAEERTRLRSLSQRLRGRQ